MTLPLAVVLHSNPDHQILAQTDYCQAQGHLSTPVISCEVFKPQSERILTYLDRGCIWILGEGQVNVKSQNSSDKSLTLVYQVHTCCPCPV